MKETIEDNLEYLDGYDELGPELQAKVEKALKEGHVDDSDWCGVYLDQSNKTYWNADITEDVEQNRLGSKGVRKSASKKKQMAENSEVCKLAFPSEAFISAVSHDNPSRRAMGALHLASQRRRSVVALRKTKMQKMMMPVLHLPKGQSPLLGEVETMKPRVPMRIPYLLKRQRLFPRNLGKLKMLTLNRNWRLRYRKSRRAEGRKRSQKVQKSMT